MLVQHDSQIPPKVPQEFPLTLNTSAFKLAIPGLYKAYPNMGMQLQFEGVGAPAISLKVIDPVYGLVAERKRNGGEKKKERKTYTRVVTHSPWFLSQTILEQMLQSPLI